MRRVAFVQIVVLVLGVLLVLLQRLVGGQLDDALVLDTGGSAGRHLLGLAAGRGPFGLRLGNQA